jgi:hypothetical protein
METLLRQPESCCECDDTADLPAGHLTIGQAAQVTGLTAKAIRYYEDIGLLPRAARGDNRYRRYTPADVQMIYSYHPSRRLPSCLLLPSRRNSTPLHACQLKINTDRPCGK